MEQLDKLIEKWTDVAECASDLSEETLANEVVEDLTWLAKVV